MDGPYKILLLLASVLLVLLALFTLIWVIEYFRRIRADKSGFQEFLQLGAPHSHDALVRAFEGIAPEFDFTGTVQVIQLGELKVPSGKIVSCDPSYLLDDFISAFTEEIPVGAWPVDAVVVEQGGDQRIAALRVSWKKEAVAFFEPAFDERAKAICARNRELPVVGVDSGTASILSEEAVPFARAAGEDAVYAPGEAKVNPFLSGNTGHLWREVQFDGAALNMFVCYSGLGDGAYACMFARNANKESLAYYLDFGFFGEAKRLLNRAS